MPWFFTTRIAVVSSGRSAPSARGSRTRPAAPANERVVRNCRRVCVIGIGSLLFLQPLSLQLALELVQEAPIGALGDDRVRVGLDHAGFVQTKGVIAQRVLGIVFPPLVILDFLKRCERVIVAVRKAAIDDRSGRSRRLGRAEIGSLEEGAQYALGCDWRFADIVAVAGQHAAEILRPRPVDGAVVDNVVEMAGTQLLRL